MISWNRKSLKSKLYLLVVDAVLVARLGGFKLTGVAMRTLRRGAIDFGREVAAEMKRTIVYSINVINYAYFLLSIFSSF